MKLNKTRSIALIFTTTMFLGLTACGGSVDAVSASTTMSSTAASVVTVNPVTNTPEEVTIISTKSESANTVTYTITDSQVLANLKFSNIDYNPEQYTRQAIGTWRWNNATTPRITVYIPNPTTSQELGYADKVTAAVKVINHKLNGSLILETTNVQSSTNNIRISYNTSHVPKGFTDYKSGSYCANVSTKPYSGNPIAPDWKNEISSTLVYVNVGNGNCEVSEDLISHEFGHALGLANHFEGFGIGAAVSVEYWDTLATLYNNTPSTTVDKVVVKRALKTNKEGEVNVPHTVQVYCEKQVRYETSSRTTLPAAQYASYRC